MQWEMPSYVRRVMQVLDDAGHRGYIVGGSLRDLLLGGTPHDYDLTTDATPAEMERIFADFRVIPTGIQHGTLTVMCEGQPVEITTHRVDGAYTDARHPEQVLFTRALAEDLSRRDFTVNAMAWHPETGLVDLFSGERDLKNRVLRTVGDPEQRFSEDALRILRAFRFCAQLGFVIEEETARGAARMAQGLSRISVERIFSELCRMLQAKGASDGLAALMAAGCAKYVFFDTVDDLIPVPLATLPADVPLRLSVLFPSLEPERATALCRRWHAPNAFCAALCAYLNAAREPLPEDPYHARHFVCRYWQYWEGALAARAALGTDVSQSLAICRKVARDGSTVELRRLAVKGKELQDVLGVSQRKTGELLLRLQDLVFRDPTLNKRPALMREAQRICKEEEAFCE